MTYILIVSILLPLYLSAFAGDIIFLQPNRESAKFFVLAEYHRLSCGQTLPSIASANKLPTLLIFPRVQQVAHLTVSF
jgi:hypothetical protein